MSLREASLLPTIGFMQGRLSPLVNGKIQAFPEQFWRDEFYLATSLGFRLMEWTLDHHGLSRNPLICQEGRREVRRLIHDSSLAVPSVTGDCFMQAPFFKSSKVSRLKLLDELDMVITSFGDLGGGILVMPLVDDGRPASDGQEKCIVDELTKRVKLLRQERVVVAFECDFPPERLSKFISLFPEDCFGINYDIGNSASMGHNSTLEFHAYGARVVNVHVKDRKLNGHTVPLGEGHADFNAVFSLLKSYGYRGNFILQTARATDGNHAATLAKYAEMTRGWLMGSSR